MNANRRIKVAVLSSCSLPIPAIKGGAVESLIETIAMENEKYNNLDLCIYSIYDEESEDKAQTYNHSRFEYLHKLNLVCNADGFVTTLIRAFKGNNVASRNYFWKIITISKLRGKLREEAFDVIVLENTIYLFNIFKDRKLFEKYKKRVYFHVHNSLVKRTSIEYKQLMAGVLSISDYLHENIRMYFDSSVHIRTVYNGIDTARFQGRLGGVEIADLREKHNLRCDSEVIVFVGRIAVEKGIKETILAFNKLNNRNYELLIVGASYFGSGAVSPFEKEIMDMVTKNKNIHISGYVPNEDIWKYYSLGSVAVLPSMWEEPLGLTMIEAQASGIPLISTISGGIPETVDCRSAILLDKNTNIVNSLEGAMNLILSDKDSWMAKAKEVQSVISEKFDKKTFYMNFVEAIWNR